MVPQDRVAAETRPMWRHRQVSAAVPSLSSGFVVFVQSTNGLDAVYHRHRNIRGRGVQFSKACMSIGGEALGRPHGLLPATLQCQIQIVPSSSSCTSSFGETAPCSGCGHAVLSTQGGIGFCRRLSTTSRIVRKDVAVGS